MKRLARWVCGSAVGMTVLLALVLRVDTPLDVWAELLRFVPYPAWLALDGVALLAGVLAGRRWLLCGLFALGLVLTVVMDLAVGSAEPGEGHLRVMTYNVKAYLADTRPQNVANIVAEVVEHDADIIVMQDADGLIDARSPAAVPLRTAFRDRQLYEFGQYIVASRVPMRDCRPEGIPYRGQTHTYVRCTVQAFGQDVELITAHLVSPRVGLNAARFERLGGLDEWQENFDDRMTQARTLASALSTTMRPVILAGDLNATQHSPVLGVLRSTGLRDAFATAGFGYGYTHGHSLRPRISFLRIDHVMVSEQLGVREAFAGGSGGSDHRPVIADLVLRR